jgi:hypothetical protein
MAKLVNLLIDVGVFLDKRVRSRDIRLRLVIVVVGDKVFDGVPGKELLELGIELGGKTRVGRLISWITLAMVKVLPEPVTPRRVWKRSPAWMPALSSAMAVGWSPVGRRSEMISKLGMVPPVYHGSTQVF